MVGSENNAIYLITPINNICSVEETADFDTLYTSHQLLTIKKKSIQRHFDAPFKVLGLI